MTTQNNESVGSVSATPTARAKAALESVRLEIEAMDLSAEKLGDGEFIEGYKFKTGKWHKLLGMVRGGEVSAAIAALKEK
jgi:hypothetical protein